MRPLMNDPTQDKRKCSLSALYLQLLVRNSGSRILSNSSLLLRNFLLGYSTGPPVFPNDGLAAASAAQWRGESAAGYEIIRAAVMTPVPPPGTLLHSPRAPKGLSFTSILIRVWDVFIKFRLFSIIHQYLPVC